VAAFGHVGIKVSTLDELEAVIPDIFGDRYRNDLVFLDAHIDPDEHVYPMSIRGGALKDMVLGKEEPS